MAFDQNTRNRLSRFVGDARALLSEEFTRQLQRTYGIDPTSGEVTTVERLGGISDIERQTADLLRETAEHYQPGFARLAAKSRRDTIERIVREQAFTVLNRLCALRMAEGRGLLIESIASGYQSRGFQLYVRLAGAALGETGDAYRTYLFSLFDEFAIDLPVLFDRFSPQGRLFPGETTLLALLDLVNYPEIEALWAEDETIGWIYQYFNSKEERKAMRDASAAPRNSRELAVRNQFFTPRYVVEFLTDNTLGRIWYEMTKGETSLKDSCRYLVRRPNEIFLAPGEQAPVQAESAENLSQEELLRQAVYIPHRPLKDPRALTMLDPACGSMHFGLYAFDLFERIYDEAWELEGERGSEALERAPLDDSLHDAYPDKEAFLRDVPRLIVERNIHGVDIDPRAVQIAGLSLWLRAQKSWRDQGLKPQERPQIHRSNVVCAEPMPGDKDLLEEFMAHQLSGSAEDKVVAWMLRKVFDAMVLAGEAGSLLKIEDEITTIVAEAKRQWRQGPKLAQTTFFVNEAERITQRALDLDASGITDAAFWTRAEERIDAALSDYAAFAEGEGAYRRRLFAGDAARGFAFIDLCRKRYDVVLMNPPFGTAPYSVQNYLQQEDVSTWTEVFAAMVSRGLSFAPSGIVGSITSRTCLTLSRLTDWRIRDLVPSSELIVDLGMGVMDAALVEACAYTCRRLSISSSILIKNLQGTISQDTRLMSSHWNEPSSVQAIERATIDVIPEKRILLGLPTSIVQLLRSRRTFEPIIGTVRRGFVLFDGNRFVRTYWEVMSNEIGPSRLWAWYSKGGDYQRHYSSVHLVTMRADDGAEMRAINQSKNGQTAQAMQGSTYYFRPGSTYTSRSQRGFAARALPAGCITSDSPAVLSESDVSNLLILGWLNSRVARLLIELQASFHKYEPGHIKELPWPSSFSLSQRDEIEKLTLQNVLWTRQLCNWDETDPTFLPDFSYTSIDEILLNWQTFFSEKHIAIQHNQKRITEIFDCIYQCDSSAAFKALDAIESDDVVVAPLREAPEIAISLISWLVGVVFGRWDIRYATGEKPTPELPDPFAPLPACPPGMLQNEQGLPAAPEDVPASYPLRLSWPGILVDDEGLPEDIAGRTREALEVIWGERAEAIEQEACQILGVRSLHEYFRKPALFFADHLQRYSKSRRQAPIYWPLSTPSGSYTLWLYYLSITGRMYRPIAGNSA